MEVDTMNQHKRLEHIARLLQLIPDEELKRHRASACACYLQGMELRRTTDTAVLQECALFSSLALAAIQDELRARHVTAPSQKSFYKTNIRRGVDFDF